MMSQLSTKSFLKNFISAWKLLKRLSGKKAFMVLLQTIVFAAVQCYSMVFQPYILSSIFASLENEALFSLYITCGVSSAIVLFFFVLCYINNVYLDVNSFNVMLTSANSSCRILYQLPFDVINKQFSEAEIQNRIDTATTNIALVIIILGQVISNTAAICILLGMFGVYSAILVGIVFLATLWAVISSNYEVIKRKKLELERQRQEDKMGQSLYESVHKIDFLSIYNGVDHVYQEYQRNRTEAWNIKWKQERLSITISALTGFIFSGFRGILSLSLFPLYSMGKLHTDRIASSFSVYDQLSAVISGYTKPFVDINTNMVAVGRLEEVFSTSSPNKINVQHNSTEPLLKAENISYSVQGRNLFTHINLTIRKGDKIALIGKNGCGKSTLLRILIGIYHSETGIITMNIESDCPKRYVSYISSNSYLYSENVKKNILMNGDGDLQQAVKTACLEDLGKDFLDKKATELSGGQAQRVNIARGLIHNPLLLVADEPTSGLSIAQGEEVIQEMLSQSNTAVMVTHHPAQLQYFNRIILLEDGKIAADGSLQSISSEPAFHRWMGTFPQDH